MLDLSKEQRDAALQTTIVEWQRNLKPGTAATPPDRPSGPEVREVRDPARGLLLLYPIQPKGGAADTPVIGLAVSFPKSPNARSVSYHVNNIFWEQEFGEG
jgi:hypothetical protein